MLFAQPKHQWVYRQRTSQNQIGSAGAANMKDKQSFYINDISQPKDSMVAAFGRYFSDFSKMQIMLGADLRSMAAFRIGVGIILILNLYVCLPDIETWYGDMGVWPMVNMVQLNPQWWSFHLINGHVNWQLFLFAVSFVFHMMMVLGYRTRFSTFMSWVMQVSLQSRNVLVLNGGDVYVRMCLFWSMFMPLGKVCSIDAALKAKKTQAQKATSKFNVVYVSVATIAFALQIAIIYWFTAVVKTGAPWKNGTAVYYALSLDAFTTPTGYILYQFPTLMKLLTHVTLFFEFWGPFLFFSPFYTQICRTIGVLGFWGMHIGFGMCMEIGLFPWLPIPCTMMLLPPWFWDKLFGWILARRKNNKSAITICVNPNANPIFSALVKMYHGVLLTDDCKLFTEAPDTNTDANQEWLKQQLHLTDTSFEKLFADLKENEFSIGAIDGSGRKYYDESAVIAMLRSSIVCWPAAYLMQIRPFSAVIGLIVKGINLRFLAKKDDYTTEDAFLQRHSGENNRKSKKPVTWFKAFRSASREFFALMCLLIVIDYNASLYLRTALWAPSLEHQIIPVLRLDQYWGMFSPQPPTEDGWYVIETELADGSLVDMYNGGKPVTWEKPGVLPPIDWKKPALVSHTFPTEKWRKYMMNLYSENLEEMKLGYGRWLCRQWNWQGPGSQDARKAAVRFSVVLMSEITLPDYQTLPVKPVIIWHHQC